ncbi:MAG TPA: type I glyceraldehyde-3-phosphate dehydrogenase [Stellaceae bacterium]|nr:type I glyceraldehyde-3-phosphate dehydrogenase [Stellaceae bacterium]
MTVRVAINGFGRIGRLVLRALHEQRRDDLQVAAINDLGSVAANAQLLKYDSVHGRFGGAIATGDDWMDVGSGKIAVLAERDPAKLPWQKLGIDVALECTGLFTSRAAAGKHLEAGAKRCIVSAPADGADYTLVMGVNNDGLTREHHVISNGSCTTNCLAPVAYVLNEGIGIAQGFMTTVHSFTGDQSTVDTLHKDMRRARAASLNMIPTSTGAAKALGLVIPALQGKLDGTAIRVPTANVSLIDLTFTSARDTAADEINAMMEKAAGSNRFKGILGVVKDQVVSSDFNHDPHSSTFDLTQTVVLGKRFCRVLAWYDNEWGFSNRMVEAAALVGKMV